MMRVGTSTFLSGGSKQAFKAVFTDKKPALAAMVTPSVRINVSGGSGNTSDLIKTSSSAKKKMRLEHNR
jgi:hypothetical protein